MKGQLCGVVEERWVDAVVQGGEVELVLVNPASGGEGMRVASWDVGTDHCGGVERSS